MTNARIERLTREALGPGKRETYTKIDDFVLRVVGIVILVITVITFASWPRDDERAPQPGPSAKATHTSASEQTPLY